MGKREVIWLLVGIFFLVLASSVLAQQGCFTEPTYTSICTQVTRTNATSWCSNLCTNNQTCLNDCLTKYFFENHDCSIGVCSANAGWCTDVPACAQVNRPAECVDRTSFTNSSVPCQTGCCILTSGTTNQCGSPAWPLMTYQECVNKQNLYSGYRISVFDTSVTSSAACAQVCGQTIGAPGRISGYVVNSSGNGIGGASIEAFSIKTTSLANGSYTLTALPIGTAIVTGTANGYGQSVSSVTVSTGATTNHNITLPAASSGRIHGFVTSGGSPLGGALVSVSGADYSQISTQGDGSYSLDALNLGSYTATASASGYGSSSQQVSLTDDAIEINFSLSLSQQATITGLILDQYNRAVPLATVRITGPSNYTAYTNQNGVYTKIVFANDTSTSYSVSATKGGYNQSSIQTVSLIKNDVKTVNLNMTKLALGACADPNTLPVSNFNVNHLPGEKALQLTWASPCPEVTGYYINRTSGGQEVALAYIPATQALQFKDTGVSWNTTYTYKIRAFFDAAPRFSNTTNTNSITTGDAACEGPLRYNNGQYLQFCQGPFNRRICNANNKVVEPTDGTITNPVNCTALGNFRFCRGPDSLGKTSCSDATHCLTSPGPGGVWVTRNSCYGSSSVPYPNYCYFEPSTPFNFCYSCSALPTKSCYDYASSDACGTNNCLPGKSCTWWVSPSNVGYCYEPGYAGTDQCSRCQVGCTQDVCDKLGDCYANSANTACLRCSLPPQPCGSYTTPQECDGGQAPTFVNDVLVASQDRCGYERCLYQSGSCGKDGDGDGNFECLDPNKVSPAEQSTCQRDRTPPVTKILPFGFISVNNATGNITFQGNDSFGMQKVVYCIDKTNTCSPSASLNYPSGTGVKTVQLNLATDNQLRQAHSQHGPGTYYLRFYSLDKYYNRENVQSRTLNVDLDAPVFTLKSCNVLTNATSGSTIRCQIATSEMVTCSDRLDTYNVVSGFTPYGAFPNQRTNSEIIDYTGLPDALYKYEINCTDDYGNLVTWGPPGITVQAQAGVNRVFPPRALNASSFRFQVYTPQIASCRLMNGTTVIESFSPSAGNNHTSSQHTFTPNFYYPNYWADCGSVGSVSLDFSVDRLGPVTRARLVSGGTQAIKSGSGWVATLTNTTAVDFVCTDQPTTISGGSAGFGCNTTKWCLTNGSSCTPNRIDAVPSVTADVTLCYYSNDSGGYQETSTNCGQIQIRPSFGINIVSPSHGVSNQPEFDLEINIPTVATDTCKWQPNVQSWIFNQITNPKYIFTPVTGSSSNYKIVNFSSQVTGFPNSFSRVPVYIACNSTTGMVSPIERFEIVYDPTPPVITSASFNPNPIVQGSSTTLSVVTDDNTVCKIGKGIPSIQFDDYDRNDFKTTHTHTIYISAPGDDNKTHYWNVSCENEAGNFSSITTAAFAVDLSAMGVIVSTSPSGASKNTNINLNVITNKAATCSYKPSNAYIPMANVGGVNHSKSLASNLSQGRYSYPVRCQFAQHYVDSSINFAIDLSAPKMIEVDDGNYSCGLDEINPNFEAEDNISSVVGYNYQILELSGTTVLYSDNVSRANPRIDDLNLTLNKNYFLKVKAKDEVGNWGTAKSSNGFKATAANYSGCREQRAPIISLVQNATATGIKVTVKCNDDTGCIGLSYGTSASSICNASTSYVGPVLVTETSYFCAEARDVSNNKGTKQVQVIISDTDTDGILNQFDQCPGTSLGKVVDENGCSASQLNTDSDEDGLPDDWEIQYSAEDCSFDPQQNDTDDDGILDGDEDYDGDGLSNYREYQQNGDPCLVKDRDGILDSWRLQYFGCIDCANAEASADPDNDGLTNLQEYNLKDTYGSSTHPNNPDTDGDGYQDKEEVDNDWDPTKFSIPGEGTPILAWIFLILGILMVLGGVGYVLILKKGKTPKPRPVYPIRVAPRPRPVPRPRVVRQPAVPPERVKIQELVAKRKAEREKEKRTKRREAFEPFVSGDRKLPKVKKIIQQKEKPVFEKLTAVAKHYDDKRKEVSPKLAAGEKKVFEELTKLVGNKKKEDVKKVLGKKKGEDIFNRLVNIVGKREGKDALKELKKYAKK
ncbi:carboxypeptidase regulatory-like domain-containing protein [Nanoarchaeota archaeon]